MLNIFYAMYMLKMTVVIMITNTIEFDAGYMSVNTHDIAMNNISRIMSILNLYFSSSI